MDKASVEQRHATDTSPRIVTKPPSKALPRGSIPKFESSNKPVSSRKPRSSVGSSKGKKRARGDLQDDENDEGTTKRVKQEEVQPEGEVIFEDDSQFFTQPALITGAKLKKYQLEGVAWMAGLYQNGISGILGSFMFVVKIFFTDFF